MANIGNRGFGDRIYFSLDVGMVLEEICTSGKRRLCDFLLI